MKKFNKKHFSFIIYFCLVIFSLIYIIYNKQQSNYLYVDHDISSNAVDSNYYNDIINNARNKYNNNEVVGILEIDNTNYIVPIMQADDNEYYLNHTPDGKQNPIGAVFLDYRVDIDSSKKLLIYGHNSSNIDMPFKILEEFYDKNYYDNHKYIEITTSKVKKKYEIFSVYVETNDFSYMDITFNSDDEYLKHIEKLKSKSMYDTGLNLNSDDEILILQTCSEHPEYRNYQKKYLLIILRRVEK